jgi:hypothetical protein
MIDVPDPTNFPPETKDILEVVILGVSPTFARMRYLYCLYGGTTRARVFRDEIDWLVAHGYLCYCAGDMFALTEKGSKELERLRG